MVHGQHRSLSTVDRRTHRQERSFAAILHRQHVTSQCHHESDCIRPCEFHRLCEEHRGQLQSSLLDSADRSTGANEREPNLGLRKVRRRSTTCFSLLCSSACSEPTLARRTRADRMKSVRTIGSTTAAIANGPSSANGALKVTLLRPLMIFSPSQLFSQLRPSFHSIKPVSPTSLSHRPSPICRCSSTRFTRTARFSN